MASLAQVSFQVAETAAWSFLSLPLLVGSQRLKELVPKMLLSPTVKTCNTEDSKMDAQKVTLNLQERGTARESASFKSSR